MENRYLRLAEQAAPLTRKPGVMVGLPYRDNWWVPGGDSYLARLIADAGGHYLAGKAGNHESYVISLEDAIQLFSGADFWIHTGMAASKKEILSADPRFGKLPFFSSARIFNNNKRSTPAGGMDFWESGTVCPDVILADLIGIFHPELLPSDSLIYYREVR
jgi:iron complex transport system substrate-binding protein